MKVLASFVSIVLRTFLESNSKNKLYPIDIHTRGTQGRQLGEALAESSFRRSHDQSAADSDVMDFEEDSAILPNGAWTWAKQNNPINEYRQPYDYDLRACDYVFCFSRFFLLNSGDSTGAPLISITDTSMGQRPGVRSGQVKKGG